MNDTFMARMRAQARQSPRRIAFPEGEDARILRAARILADEGIAHPLLVGDGERIRGAARSSGVALEGLELMECSDEAARQRAGAFVAEGGLLPKSLAEKYLCQPLHFAARAVCQGMADAMVAGAVCSTAEVILAAQLFIGSPDGQVPSSVFLMEIPGFDGPQGELIAFADCGVQPNPAPGELADIAIATAETVRALLRWTPRIALLSFSTKGSARHPDVDKVLEALEQIKARRPDLLVEGELQLDAAIDREVARRKGAEDSAVAGRANILVFPNLDAGNIAYKAVQRFAGAAAYGPFLQGFAKTVSDLSRGSGVADIVGVSTMAVVRAQGMDG